MLALSLKERRGYIHIKIEWWVYSQIRQEKALGGCDGQKDKCPKGLSTHQPLLSQKHTVAFWCFIKAFLPSLPSSLTDLLYVHLTTQWQAETKDSVIHR